MTKTLHGSILVVDDSSDGRAVISSILRCVGLVVKTAENGEAACRMALEEEPPFDLIFMDLNMPVMDGYSATMHLRKHGYAGRIVALTADSNKGAHLKCLAAGCDDYAAKPITFEMLFDFANRNLEAINAPVSRTAAHGSFMLFKDRERLAEGARTLASLIGAGSSVDAGAMEAQERGGRSQTQRGFRFQRV